MPENKHLLRRTATVAATAATAILATAGATVAASTTGQSTSGPAPAAATVGQAAAAAATPPVWAGEYMERRAKISATRAVADAKNYSLIVATKRVYTPYVNAMKAAQPNLLLAVYTNGVFAKSSEVSGLPDSYFLKDARGNRIKHREYDLWLMNPASPGWMATRKALCLREMAASNYNACALDNLGPAPINPTYVSAAPINPATHAAYTQAQWLASTTKLSSYVKSGIAPRPLVGNSLGNGNSYFDGKGATSQLMKGLSYGLVETFLRGGTAPINDYPSVDSWKANVDMLVDATKRGTVLLTCTKTWTSSTAAQRAQWRAFALGSFLLGSDGKHRFYFTENQDEPKTTFNSILATKIGTPTGAYTAGPGGTYKRTFTGGVVVVNPGRGTASIPLGKTYKTAGGSSLSSITLSGHNASILLG